MNDKYLEFHCLKKDIANKLNSIEDGTEMAAFCNDMLEDITVSDRLNEVAEMFSELQRLKLILLASEES